MTWSNSLLGKILFLVPSNLTNSFLSKSYFTKFFVKWLNLLLISTCWTASNCCLNVGFEIFKSWRLASYVMNLLVNKFWEVIIDPWIPLLDCLAVTPFNFTAPSLLVSILAWARERLKELVLNSSSQTHLCLEQGFRRPRALGWSLCILVVSGSISCLSFLNLTHIFIAAS